MNETIPCFYPEALFDGVVDIKFEQQDIIINFCKNLAHATTYDTLEHVFDKSLSFIFLGDTSKDPIYWDPQPIISCPCYELDGKVCGEIFSVSYILNQLPKNKKVMFEKRIDDTLNRKLRDYYLKIHPGGIDCINKRCNPFGVTGLAYPIKKKLTHKEFEGNKIKNIYQCNTCGITFCNKCKCQYFTKTLPKKIRKLSHDTHSCKIMEKLKNNLDPNVELIKKMTQPCPHCGIKINIYKGCNRVTCRCGKSFCWRCGRKVKGDTPDAVYKHLRKYHPGKKFERPEKFGIMN